MGNAFYFRRYKGGFMVTSLLSFGDVLKDTEQFFTNFSDLESASISSMLWIAIALIIAFTVCKFTVKKEKQPLVNKIFAFIVLAYTVTSIILFTVIYFVTDVAEKEYFVPITYYPMLVFAIVTAASVLAMILKPQKLVKICALSAICASAFALAVCLIVYSASGDAEKWNWIELSGGQNAGLYISALVLVALIIVAAIFTDRNSKPFDSNSLTFASVCVALSFALSYVSFLKMPFGGSITFASLLPLMLYSYMFGTRKGVIAGVVYGVLQAVQDAWILHPAQFLLDYPVAFAGIGLAGMLRSMNILSGKTRLQFTLGAIIGGVARFISHFFSGALAFGIYGAKYAEAYGIPALSNEYFYSFVYQSMYVIPDIIIVIIAGAILLSSKSFVNQIERYSLMNFKKAQHVDKTV